MTEHITPTADETKIIADLMAAPHPVTLATIAKVLGTTELAAAQKMPEDAVAFVAGDVSEKFDDVWAALAAWEKVTLFLVHAGHVFEIQGKLTAGKRAMGYYNILAKDGTVAFSVYVGRENHQLIPAVVDAFKADKARFTA